MAKVPGPPMMSPASLDMPPKLTPHPSPGVSASAHNLSPLELKDFDPSFHPASSGPVKPPTDPPRMVTTHQLKGVPTFSGRDRNIRIEDWVRDMKYMFEAKGLTTDEIQFQEVVRNTSGRARDVVLNLESGAAMQVTAEEVFKELSEEFAEDSLVTSPMTRFYSREQKPTESAGEYAVALEALLRRIEESGRRQGYSSLFGGSRDLLLTTQFLAGLRDEPTRQRLAPMQPRNMAYRELRAELRVIAEEQRHRNDRLRRDAMIDGHQPLYNMSGVTNQPPKAAAGGSARPQDKEDRSTTAASMARATAGPSLEQLLTQQMDELQAMRLEQREALQQVRADQSQLHHRLAQLEGVVYARPRWQQAGRPAPRQSQYSGCYRCGSKQHLARSCPDAGSMAPWQPPETSMGPLPTATPQVQQTTAPSPTGPLNQANPLM